ncbi:MAG TPA: glycine oxidase ThiO [Terriglobales bacterium]|nr:glycine oxidase ThiO [Terriglobales bacterium]
MQTADVVIAGAGIIGITLALELHSAGASVVVLDRGEPGREASRAAAGMLVTQDPDTDPLLLPLARLSAELYPKFLDGIEADSGIKVHYETNGAIYVAEENEQFSVAPLSPPEAQELEPALAEHPRAFLLCEQRLDPRLLIQSAVASARKRGIHIHHEAEVLGVALGPDHRLEVVTRQGRYAPGIFVNCAGAWASQIRGCSAPARPVKGQMLAVVAPNCALHRVIRASHVYLVPRSDGRIVIGSTLEEAGFDKTVNPETIQHLHQAAANLVPGMGEASILEAWAGLRPGSPDDLPVLGPGVLPGSYIATGHFRNGILLAPATARVMSQFIQGQAVDLDLKPFSPSRFARSELRVG